MDTNNADKKIPKADLKGLTPAEMERFCARELAQKAGQGLRAAVLLFRRGIEDFDLMTDLNRPFRERLKERCTLSSLAVEQRTTADDGTMKILYRLDDGNTVEGVLIPGPGRLTLCVSTQVGCASGCAFCRTGTGGLVRNLSSAEIINQVFAAGKIAWDPVTNIVLMGAGEPLGNYDAVKTFVETATDRSGMGFSPRKVTLSTCGVAPMIEKMAREINASLAVSLNATTDEVRDRLMPINKAYPLAELIKALRYYSGKTGRVVTIEYVLIKGINDTNEDARRLTKLLAGLPCMINILLFNPFPGSTFARPGAERASTFRDMLVGDGYVAVVRNSRGKDIHAACGQLRAASETTGNRRAKPGRAEWSPLRQEQEAPFNNATSRGLRANPRPEPRDCESRD